MPRMNDHLPMNRVLECLERSGYLLESKLVRALTDHGYFVEPNQVVRDPRTGKSREIDLVAEYYGDYIPEHQYLCVKTIFVVEIINNKFPLVLLTQRPSSPNEDSESHVKFICTPEPNAFYQKLDVYGKRGPERDSLFSQYCTITPKKGEAKELMASHSDDLYSSLQKLAEYTEGEVASWDTIEDRSKDDFWRLFFWHPMLVVGGQLIVARTNEAGATNLEETISGFLEFNWHAGEERRTTVIEVITADALLDRCFAVVSADVQMEKALHAIRVQGDGGDNKL